MFFWQYYRIKWQPSNILTNIRRILWLGHKFLGLITFSAVLRQPYLKQYKNVRLFPGLALVEFRTNGIRIKRGLVRCSWSRHLPEYNALKSLEFIMPMVYGIPNLCTWHELHQEFLCRGGTKTTVAILMRDILRCLGHQNHHAAWKVIIYKSRGEPFVHTALPRNELLCQLFGVHR